MKKVITLISLSLASQLLLNPAIAQDSKTQVDSTVASAAQNTPTQTTQFQKIDSQVGTGLEAVSGKTVVVHYSGWLLDPSAADQKGKPFDSSIGRGPFSFPLGAGRVIQAWDQGFVGMKVGGKRTLIIPSAMGYGERGAGNVIPPGADLIFDIELLDVITPPSLEKIDKKIGKGKEATAGQQVSVHYTGWLRDSEAKDQHGKEFDSSIKRGPFSFKLGAHEVILGWDQGVAGMKIGGKRTLIIPAALAYGSREVGNGLIPANSDLVFDVELLQIK
ncbi:MAG: FKBP-type peptidyl-prolyl cis-trans isomerase [Undibacterium sp.]|nr:FKBP-type peptidyl-prolyl cis-trans isomerase [Undibacterium sp.]